MQRNTCRQLARGFLNVGDAPPCGEPIPSNPLSQGKCGSTVSRQHLKRSPGESSGRAKFKRKVRYPAGGGRVRGFVPRHRSRTGMVACLHVVSDQARCRRTGPGSKLEVGAQSQRGEAPAPWSWVMCRGWLGTRWAAPLSKFAVNCTFRRTGTRNDTGRQHAIADEPPQHRVGRIIRVRIPMKSPGHSEMMSPGIPT